MSGRLITFELDPAALKRAGQRAVELIVERTLRGEDAGGKAFRPYSTKPFALPYNAETFTRRTETNLLKVQETLNIFTTRQGGSLWAVVEGGYKAYKAARWPKGGETVNLSATGAMLRSLTVVRHAADADGGEVVVGFVRPEMAERAGYHMGRGRVERRFLGLTDGEGQDVASIIRDGITLRVS